MSSVLWLTHQPPLPDVTGSRVRSLALIRELAARGWDVTLFTLDTGVPADRTGLEAFAEVFVEPLQGSRLLRIGTDLLRGRPFQDGMFRSPQAVERAHALIRSRGFDAVVAGGLFMLPYVPAEHVGAAFLDSHNVETVRVETMAQALGPSPKGLAARAQLGPTRRYEERAARALAGVFACSGEDATWFARFGRVTVVPNGVDTVRVRPREGTAPGGPVLFVGSMDYGPNVDGARMLAEEVAPLVLGARVRLVGSSPPPALTALASDRVEVTGMVDDIAAAFRSARVLAVPLRMGGGTRLKILEAMAHGVPVVTTTIGVQGIAAEPDRDVLVADDPPAFARALERVLSDDGLAARLARNARELVERAYDWRAAVDALEPVLSGGRGR